MPDKVTEDGGIPETPEKEWDDAFKEAEDKGDRAELSPADDPKNVPAGPEVTPPPEKAEEPPPEKPVEEPPADPSLQKPGESDEAFEQRWKTLQGIYKHDKETWETEKAQMLKDLEAARKPPEPPPAKPAEPTPSEIVASAAALYDSLTAEQKEALKDYEQDFDVVSKMEGIKRGVELKKLRQEVDEKLAALDAKVAAQESKITPVLKKAAESDEEAHFDAIRDVHGDYEKYVEDGSIVKWIETKPKYLQPALKQTYEKGSAEDAIDLINDFKRENDITPTPPPENVVPITRKKAEKRQALAAVDTRRGAIATQSKIADDYEGAFDEALNK
jgi:hypothetical protein